MAYNNINDDRVQIYKNGQCKGEYTIALSFSQDFLDELMADSGGTVKTRQFIESWLTEVSQKTAEMPMVKLGQYSLQQWIFDKNIAVDEKKYQQEKAEKKQQDKDKQKQQSPEAKKKAINAKKKKDIKRPEQGDQAA